MKSPASSRLQVLSIPSTFVFPVNADLISDQRAARERLGPVPSSGRLIEEHSYAECTTWPVDGNGSPVDFESLPV